MFSRQQLDQLVLDVEFVLLSVVQGVALSGLGIEAIQVLRHPSPSACVFLVSGLVFVLAFWAGAMLHAVSIVRWPMDLPHYFFYFVVGLLEMITFAQMEHPRAWFGWSCVFFVLGVGLYAYDLLLIHERRKTFEGDDDTRRLYAHIVKRQRFEMRVVMPAGFLFSLSAWWMIGQRPGLTLAFAVAQLAFSIALLATLLRSFAERIRMITACTEPDY